MLGLSARLGRVSRRARVPVTPSFSCFGTTPVSADGADTHPAGSFLSGSNSIYVEEMFKLWSQDPTKVHSSWDVFFKTGTYQPNQVVQPNVQAATVVGGSASGAGSTGSDSVRIVHLIRAYQDHGHQMAQLDPLGLRRMALRLGVNRDEIPDTNPQLYGFSDEDWDRPLNLEGAYSESQGGLLRSADIDGDGNTTFGELMTFLHKTYSGTVGYEFTHIRNREQVNWITDQIEKPINTPSAEATKQILERLDFATTFESTLAKRFNTAKRFGLEGLESLIPGLKEMIDVASLNGAEDFVFGMAHRGRLNVLSNVIRKPMEMIFKEFLGTDAENHMNEGDGNDDWSSSETASPRHVHIPKLSRWTQCPPVPDGEPVTS